MVVIEPMNVTYDSGSVCTLLLCGLESVVVEETGDSPV